MEVKSRKAKENGISHLRERPSVIRRAGFYLGFFVWGEVDPKKNFRAGQRRENSFMPSRGPGDAAPENFEKIVFRIG